MLLDPELAIVLLIHEIVVGARAHCYAHVLEEQSVRLNQVHEVKRFAPELHVGEHLLSRAAFLGIAYQTLIEKRLVFVGVCADHLLEESHSLLFEKQNKALNQLDLLAIGVQVVVALLECALALLFTCR